MTESLSGDLEFRVYQNDVTGNEALSFKTEGLNYLTSLNFNYNTNLTAGKTPIKFTGFSNFRGTDDPQFQIRRDTLRLQNAYVTLSKRKHFEFTGGYFSERFTQFTMSTSLLGINSRLNLTEGLTWKTFVGRDRRARGGEQYGRYSTGSRLNWEILSGQIFGISYVQTKDVLSTLNEAEAAGVSDTESNEVYGIDYEGRFESIGTTITGEFAQSNFDSSPTTSAGEADRENAFKIAGQTRTDLLGTFRLNFETVNPGFRSISGFATEDRTRWNFKWNRKLGESWNFTANFENWWNGLETPRTNDVVDWDVGTAFDPSMKGGWDFSAQASFLDRRDEGRAASGDPNETEEQITNLALNNEFNDVTLNSEFTFEDQESDSETRTQFNFEFSIPFTLFGTEFSYVNDDLYEVEENDLGRIAETDRRLRFNNELVVGRGGAQSFTISQGYLEEDTDGAAEIIRESLRLEYLYRINPELGNSISFSYYINDNDDEGSSTQDYQEETVDLTVNLSF